MFFNELDLLELRLMELYEHVDYFVIVEANQTHVGNPKEFLFEKNELRYSKWLDKIIYVKVDDFPPDVPGNAQFLENYHREQIVRGLVDANPGDRIMVSDIDEIPNMEIVKQHLDYPGWIHFKCDLFYFYVNNQCANGFGGAVMSPLEVMVSPQRMRWMAIRKGSWWAHMGDFENVIFHAGWHYSYLSGGDAERVKYKANNILEGHNTTEVIGTVENVAKKIKNQQDLYNRRSSRYKQSFVDITNNKPKHLDEWLVLHPEYYYEK